jgi:hypothetical protein
LSGAAIVLVIAIGREAHCMSGTACAKGVKLRQSDAASRFAADRFSSPLK